MASGFIFSDFISSSSYHFDCVVCRSKFLLSNGIVDCEDQQDSGVGVFVK